MPKAEAAHGLPRPILNDRPRVSVPPANLPELPTCGAKHLWQPSRLGQYLMARDFDRQLAEFQVRVAVLNGFTALSIPVSKVMG